MYQRDPENSTRSCLLADYLQYGSVLSRVTLSRNEAVASTTTPNPSGPSPEHAQAQVSGGPGVGGWGGWLRADSRTSCLPWNDEPSPRLRCDGCVRLRGRRWPAENQRVAVPEGSAPSVSPTRMVAIIGAVRAGFSRSFHAWVHPDNRARPTVLHKFPIVSLGNRSLADTVSPNPMSGGLRTPESAPRGSGQIWLVDRMKCDRLTARPKMLGILALTVAGIVFVCAIAHAFPWTVTWELWTVLTAMGTIGATLVALALALGGWLDSRAAAAKVVAAWVTDEYRPREDGLSYRRTTRVHIANEANEPVFNAKVSVHVGRDETPLGPLSVPAPISVLPPRRELVFDISIPLLAHLDTWSPKATLYFTDPQGRRWLRLSNGELRNVSRQRTFWSKSSRGVDERQLGDMTSVLNPMMVALAGLRDPGTTPEELVMLLAPEARGWVELNWDQLRSELQRYQPTSMVDYPAERIARIKLSGDATLEGRQVEGEGLELTDYMFMTLTLNPEQGWRVLSVGEHVPPDAICFGGSLLADVLPRISRCPSEDQ